MSFYLLYGIRGREARLAAGPYEGPGELDRGTKALLAAGADPDRLEVRLAIEPLPCPKCGKPATVEPCADDRHYWAGCHEHDDVDHSFAMTDESRAAAIWAWNELVLGVSDEEGLVILGEDEVSP